MKHESKNPGGRPKSFDRETVLDAAVRVFWEKGYEGASLDDLTKAMGINRPSLYATFGNKHGLFLEALDRYTAVQGSAQAAPLREVSDVRQAIVEYYREIIRTVCSVDGPCGCLIASVATEVAERDPGVKQKISTNLKRSQDVLDRRLQDSGGHHGHLSGAVILSAGMSLAQRARLGASKPELSAIADGYIDLFFPAP
ncbi:MAG: TetR/AcrR family transcriptional regulator [Pseudomonadota bacterium]